MIRSTQRSKLRGDKDVDGGQGRGLGCMRKMQTVMRGSSGKDGTDGRDEPGRSELRSLTCRRFTFYLMWLVGKWSGPNQIATREKHLSLRNCVCSRVRVEPRTRRDKFKNAQRPQKKCQILLGGVISHAASVLNLIFLYILEMLKVEILVVWSLLLTTTEQDVSQTPGH